MHRDEFANQLNQSSDAVVQDDLRARHHGRVAVCASGDDFSQPRLKRLRLVSRRTPVVCGESEIHVADWETRAEPLLSRRVVLAPGSPNVAQQILCFG